MSTEINRRKFIKKAVAGIVTAQLGYLVYDALKNTTSELTDEEFFSAGKVDFFEKGKLYPFNSGNFYLSVLEDGGMLALSVKCTHLGCVIRVKEEGFECPCHASAFDKYGEVLSPPATRALDIFPIRIVKGEILVDITQAIKRKSFDKSQLTYA